ncbi:hypothetical protein C5471_00165 [Photorhabdus tasmaniensis]|uniref:Uncharacterized protein n=1 Tax=Photorhabdus tasmaniensis TaxID=1004159 RepID=A0ABX0GE19_9GAMM|nr:hypothetical protein [Photorhabdus tasmaniensis]
MANFKQFNNYLYRHYVLSYNLPAFYWLIFFTQHCVYALLITLASLLTEFFLELDFINDEMRYKTIESMNHIAHLKINYYFVGKPI